MRAIGLLSRSPAAREDGLLVSENAASQLLSLAAQIALEVGHVRGLVAHLKHETKGWATLHLSRKSSSSLGKDNELSETEHGCLSPQQAYFTSFMNTKSCLA